MLIRPGEKALEHAIDQAGIKLVHLIPAQSEAVHRAGGKVFNQHVGGPEQIARDSGTVLVLEVDTDTALVAIEIREEAGGKPL